jgi:hypothetical protein
MKWVTLSPIPEKEQEIEGMAGEVKGRTWLATLCV